MPSFSAVCLDFPSIPMIAATTWCYLSCGLCSQRILSTAFFVVRCCFGDLIIRCGQPGRDGILFRLVVLLLHISKISAGTCCVYSYVFQWGYDGKQPSLLSLGTTSRLSGNQLEDDGSSVCLYRVRSVLLRLI